MRPFGFQRQVILAGLGLYSLLAASFPARAADSQPQLPQFPQIEQAVRAYFGSLPTYQSGDVITRSQIEPLLEKEKSLDWLSNAERSAILGQLLEDDDFLATQLRTPAGRSFVAQISRYPQGLDRLDRLSRLDNGHKTVRSLIHVRDGYKLIETLATTPNGKALGNVLAKKPKGVDFNKPTGRIYTQEMLVAHLKRLYDSRSLSAPPNTTARGGST